MFGNPEQLGLPAPDRASQDSSIDCRGTHKALPLDEELWQLIAAPVDSPTCIYRLTSLSGLGKSVCSWEGNMVGSAERGQKRRGEIDMIKIYYIHISNSQKQKMIF